MKKSHSKQVIEFLEEMNPEAVLMDGFEMALVGVASQHPVGPIALYDRSKCIQVLVDGGMSYEGAEEFFSFNCESAYVGKHTPIIAQIFEEE
jgi:hypothetical protein